MESKLKVKIGIKEEEDWTRQRLLNYIDKISKHYFNTRIIELDGSTCFFTSWNNKLIEVFGKPWKKQIIWLKYNFSFIPYRLEKQDFSYFKRMSDEYWGTLFWVGKFPETIDEENLFKKELDLYFEKIRKGLDE